MAHEETAAEGVVRLWTVDVDALDCDRLLPLLSDTERARAAAQPAGAVRNRFVAARATLRAGLSELTGTDPTAIALGQGAGGKPELAGGGPHRFNLSHSGRIALVALGIGREVGVDVERRRPRARLDAIARRCFSGAELEALGAATTESDRLEIFYAVWTAREAFAKAAGQGLAAAAGSFEIPPRPAGGEAPVPISEPGGPQPRFSLWRLAPAPGYTGALVAGGEGWRLEGRALPSALAAP